MEQIFQNKCSITDEFSKEKKMTLSLTGCFPLITAQYCENCARGYFFPILCYPVLFHQGLNFRFSFIINI